MNYLERDAVNSLVESCVFEIPHGIAQAGAGHWKLDQEIRASFASHLAMYEQGLTSALEMYNFLTLELNKNRE